MNKKLLVILVVLFTHKAGANSFVLTCASRMGQISTMTYVSLIQHLVKEKNAIAPQALREFLSQSTAPNPMDYVSDILSSEDRYSFGKAFSNSRDIDWELAKQKLEPLTEELDHSQVARDQARTDTRNLFVPIPVSSKFDFLGSSNVEVNNPAGDQPAFIRYVKEEGTYFIDLATQNTRLLSEDEISHPSLLKLRDGRVLVSYRRPDLDLMEFVVEEGLSGKNVKVLNLKEYFPEMTMLNSLGLRPHLFETSSGDFRLILNWPGQREVLVFDSKDNHHFTVKVPEDTMLHFTTNGRILANSRRGNLVGVKELTENGQKILLSDYLPSRLSTAGNDFISLKSGKTLYVLGGQADLAGIYDLDDLGHPRGDLNELKVGFPKLTEDHMGQPKIFKLDYSDSSKTKWVVTFTDLKGNTENILGPIEKGNTWSPAFIKLKDGRALGFFLITPSKVGTNSPNGDSPLLYMVDLHTKEVMKMTIRDSSIVQLFGVEELEDGRIFGIFQEKQHPISGQIKIWQLYGPLENGGAGLE